MLVKSKKNTSEQHIDWYLTQLLGMTHTINCHKMDLISVLAL
jgi:hypothetical protein